MSYDQIPGRAAYLWQYDEFIAQAPRNAVIVEVGVALGKSIAYCAAKCIELSRSDITIIAVDPWGGYARNGEQQESGPPSPDGDYELFLRTMGQHCPEELKRIEIMRLDSVTAAAKILRGSRRCDLVVLDADHTFDAVTADIKAWWSVCKVEGWMGGDDWMPDFPGVEEAVTKFFPPEEIEVRHEQEWGTWLVRGVR